MHITKSFGSGCLGLAALLLVAGCSTSKGTSETAAGGGVATQVDVQSLQNQINDMRAELDKVSQQAASADAKATAAQQTAERAATDARASSEKADMMFKKSLQK